MQPLADALEQDPELAVQPGWAGLISQVRDVLRAIVLFGVPEAMPSSGLEISRARSSRAMPRRLPRLQLGVANKLAQSRKLLDLTFPAPSPLPPDPVDAARAAGALVKARLDAYTEAARILLGNEIVILPAIRPRIPEGVTELAAAVGHAGRE